MGAPITPASGMFFPVMSKACLEAKDRTRAQATAVPGYEKVRQLAQCVVRAGRFRVDLALERQNLIRAKDKPVGKFRRGLSGFALSKGVSDITRFGPLRQHRILDCLLIDARWVNIERHQNTLQKLGPNCGCRRKHDRRHGITLCNV